MRRPCITFLSVIIPQDYVDLLQHHPDHDLPVYLFDIPAGCR